MKKLKKDEYVRFRVNKLEKERLDKIVTLTCRKRSDLYRDAIFSYIKDRYPECMAELESVVLPN